MPRLDISPTKSNLRKVKGELSFAEEGFELLEQKREILVMEIMKHFHKLRRAEDEFISLLNNFYESVKCTAMEMGSDVLSQKSLWEERGYEITFDETTLMGITMSDYVIEILESPFIAARYGTAAVYEESRIQCLKVIRSLGEFASLTRKIFLLSRELKKVQRRVNALEKIFIPYYEESRNYISNRLEEMEREEFFIKKMINEKQ